MDLSQLSETELTKLASEISVELDRRWRLQVREKDIIETIRVHQPERVDGDPWVQPLGAFDAYLRDAVVSHKGKTWESLLDFNVWEPGISGWRAQADPEQPETAPAWVQPTGAHDAYPYGAKVTHAGKTWSSTVANNVWAPSVYGWITI